MLRSTERIRTTLVGSLVRPPEIRAYLARRQAGEQIDESAFDAALREGVAAVVARQRDVGIDVPSDGEYGKAHWIWYVTERLSGVEAAELGKQRPEMAWWMQSADRADFAAFYAAYEPVQRYDWSGDAAAPLGRLPAPIQFARFTGPVAYRGGALVRRDVANLAAASRAAGVEEAFLAVASPMAVELGQSNPAYATDEAFVQAIAEALREEYRAIVEGGFLLQVDDALLPQWVSAAHAAGLEEAEVDRFIRVRIEALNWALEGIAPERVRFHVCWGSWNGPHSSDAPLVDILDYVLLVNAQAYLIESANARHEHEWQVWEDRTLPEDKVLVPGVVSHQTNVVEHPELVAWRIENFARLLGRERVMAGTDCGFCQGWHEVRVHPSIQWAKLEALAKGAELASARLFG